MIAEHISAKSASFIEDVGHGDAHPAALQCSGEAVVPRPSGLEDQAIPKGDGTPQRKSNARHRLFKSCLALPECRRLVLSWHTAYTKLLVSSCGFAPLRLQNALCTELASVEAEQQTQAADKPMCAIPGALPPLCRAYRSRCSRHTRRRLSLAW